MTALEQASREFVQAAQRLPTLFDLQDEAYRLMARLEENDAGDADIADLVLIDQMLMEKTESYVSVIRSLEAMADAREAEEHRLRDRKQTARRHAEWLKNRLLVHMQTSGRARIETARFTLSIRQNPQSVVVLDAALVPTEFQRTKIEVSVDKRSILEHAKATGEIVPGVELTRTERLEVR